MWKDNYEIFTKKELEAMLRMAEDTGCNVVVFTGATSIGHVVHICPQDEKFHDNSEDLKLEGITDFESW